MDKSSVFKKIEKIGIILEKKIVIPIVIILGFLMVIDVVYGVFARYVLSNPPSWTEELARYFMVWMALLATSICQRRDEHVYITFVIDRLPQILKRAVKIITKLAILYFFYVMFSRGIVMVQNAEYQVSTTMGISMMYPLSIIPLAALVNMIQVILQILLEFRPPEHQLEIDSEKEQRRKERQARLKKMRREVDL